MRTVLTIIFSAYTTVSAQLRGVVLLHNNMLAHIRFHFVQRLNATLVVNSSMRAIEVTRGMSTTYMGNPIHADWYTVVYEGKIVVRTTNKRIALYYYNSLPEKGSTA